MTAGKTSTFIIHHDRCDPAQWTPGDLLAFARFVKNGSMVDAAALARRGMQLVLSDHHQASGGDIEAIGWSPPEMTDSLIAADLAEAVEHNGDGDITEVVRVYRGPVQFAVRIPIGDDDGNLEGYEFEMKPTLEEAQDYLASIEEAAAAQAQEGGAA